MAEWTPALYWLPLLVHLEESCLVREQSSQEPKLAYCSAQPQVAVQRTLEDSAVLKPVNGHMYQRHIWQMAYIQCVTCVGRGFLDRA